MCGLLYALDAHLHGHWRLWPVAGIARHFRDLVRDVLTFDDFAKNRMLVVEPRRGRDGQKELAAVCAGSGVGHRKFSRLRVLQRGMKLVAKFVARSAAAAAFGASTLNHK